MPESGLCPSSTGLLHLMSLPAIGTGPIPVLRPWMDTDRHRHGQNQSRRITVRKFYPKFKIGYEHCLRMFIVEQPSIPPLIFVFQTVLSPAAWQDLIFAHRSLMAWIRIRQPSDEAFSLEQETEKRRLTSQRSTAEDDETAEGMNRHGKPNLFPDLVGVWVSAQLQDKDY